MERGFLMTFLYKSLETFEFTYGGEYPVVRTIMMGERVRGYICIDNLGDESYVPSSAGIVY